MQFLSHPDVLISGVFLWAHHEKVVVVDQTLAFVGGIDLAFGRWDNACHMISDDHKTPSHTHIPNITELASAALNGFVSITYRRTSFKCVV